MRSFILVRDWNITIFSFQEMKSYFIFLLCLVMSSPKLYLFVSVDEQTIFLCSQNRMTLNNRLSPKGGGYPEILMTTKVVYFTCPISLFRRFEYCKVTSAELLMDFQGQKTNLSFSIENILRDDFSRQRRQKNVVSLQTRESSFEPWATSPPVLRYYAVHYSPYVVMKCLPTSAHRVGTRFHRVNGSRVQFLPAEPKNIDEESCKDKAIQNDCGKNFKFSTVLLKFK